MIVADFLENIGEGVIETGLYVKKNVSSSFCILPTIIHPSVGHHLSRIISVVSPSTDRARESPNFSPCWCWRHVSVADLTVCDSSLDSFLQFPAIGFDRNRQPPVSSLIATTTHLNLLNIYTSVKCSRWNFCYSFSQRFRWLALLPPVQESTLVNWLLRK